ncbi:dTDP-4-dehydrorhamnose reductase [Megavirus baoshan]|uniref:dTDP-4-dehydrorhamnose reductase n=1 Tax=Megavirus baoshan TaxID=2496520 RepID=A0A3S8UX10_9VIRU|nr:dTDP-4-dehydrorhamnose reductase [Megavirus baoshan]AZL89322.1 dTDP-4-dehydrorhamnose reductase [Megavirus baoshan]
MKIIIFGPNGMLGNYMLNYFKNKHDVVSIDRKIIDAMNVDLLKLTNTLSNYRTSKDDVLVINCVGVIPQRNDINESRTFIKVNTLFPHMLSYCCDLLGFKMIHISTDCVYNGDKGNYSENDCHNETNIYGVSKSLGEPTNCCVMRTSIIGQEIYNKKSLLEWVISQNNKTVYGFINHFWNGVTCLQLAKIIEHMIDNNIFWNGVRHIHSPDIVNKYQLIEYISETYNLSIDLQEKKTDIINKTLKSIYPSFIEIPPIKKQIEDLLDFSLN